MRRRLLFLVLVILTLFALMVFLCGGICDATFQSRSQLTRHRNSNKCAKNAAQHAASQAVLSQADEQPAKRARVEEPDLHVHTSLHDETHAVSFFFLCSFVVLTLLPPQTSSSSQPSAEDLARRLQPSRSGRLRRLPRRFVDPLPDASSGLAPVSGTSREDPQVPAPPHRLASLPSAGDSSVTTGVNPQTGMFRKYPHRPTVDPDAIVPLSTVCDSPDLVGATRRRLDWFLGMTRSLAGLLPRNIVAPFENITQFRLMEWHFNNSTSKSNSDTNLLISDVLLSPDMDREHLRDFTVERGERLLDREAEFAAEDGWEEATLQLPVPCTGFCAPEERAATFEVPNFFFRRILPIIVSVFQNSPIGSLHFTPFEQWKRSTAGKLERVYSELYNSQAWLDEHVKIRAGYSGQLETVIAAILFYSDSTHLTQFGTKSVWPIYMFFGNESKYSRSKPSMFSAHHIGYIPSVRDLSLLLAVPYVVLDP
jgi:hypothetical protein